ncbi:LYST [Lepeophtheirus salmonis]|uniref:LYST n=1 Tax=Lepeophtheirus salmonis TaxID=72036 RepID=A0A7R8CG70_LEPSM|nr:LYST [Lepeophtheirus salmonis]CAF2807183.1 LYST [Lepeophtheirus salmonis]
MCSSLFAWECLLQRSPVPLREDIYKVVERIVIHYSLTHYNKDSRKKRDKTHLCNINSVFPVSSSYNASKFSDSDSAFFARLKNSFDSKEQSLYGEHSSTLSTYLLLMEKFFQDEDNLMDLMDHIMRLFNLIYKNHKILSSFCLFVLSSCITWETRFKSDKNVGYYELALQNDIPNLLSGISDRAFSVYSSFVRVELCKVAFDITQDYFCDCIPEDILIRHTKYNRVVKLTAENKTVQKLYDLIVNTECVNEELVILWEETFRLLVNFPHFKKFLLLERDGSSYNFHSLNKCLENVAEYYVENAPNPEVLKPITKEMFLVNFIPKRRPSQLTAPIFEKDDFFDNNTHLIEFPHEETHYDASDEDSTEEKKSLAVNGWNHITISMRPSKGELSVIVNGTLSFANKSAKYPISKGKGFSQVMTLFPSVFEYSDIRICKGFLKEEDSLALFMRGHQHRSRNSEFIIKQFPDLLKIHPLMSQVSQEEILIAHFDPQNPKHLLVYDEERDNIPSSLLPPSVVTSLCSDEVIDNHGTRLWNVVGQCGGIGTLLLLEARILELKLPDVYFALGLEITLNVALNSFEGKEDFDLMDGFVLLSSLLASQKPGLFTLSGNGIQDESPSNNLLNDVHGNSATVSWKVEEGEEVAKKEIEEECTYHIVDEFMEAEINKVSPIEGKFSLLLCKFLNVLANSLINTPDGSNSRCSDVFQPEVLLSLVNHPHPGVRCEAVNLINWIINKCLDIAHKIIGFNLQEYHSSSFFEEDEPLISPPVALIPTLALLPYTVNELSLAHGIINHIHRVLAKDIATLKKLVLNFELLRILLATLKAVTHTNNLCLDICGQDSREILTNDLNNLFGLVTEEHVLSPIIFSNKGDSINCGSSANENERTTYIKQNGKIANRVQMANRFSKLYKLAGQFILCSSDRSMQLLSAEKFFFKSLVMFSLNELSSISERPKIRSIIQKEDLKLMSTRLFSFGLSPLVNLDLRIHILKILSKPKDFHSLCKLGNNPIYLIKELIQNYSQLMSEDDRNFCYSFVKELDEIFSKFMFSDEIIDMILHSIRENKSLFIHSVKDNVMKAQTAESKTYIDAIRLNLIDKVKAQRGWKSIVEQLTHDMGPWVFESHRPKSWFLGEVEGEQRMRIRIEQRRLKISKKHYLPEHMHKGEEERLQYNPFQFLLVGPLGMSEIIIDKLSSDNHIIMMEQCHLILPDDKFEGEVLVGNNALYYVHEFFTMTWYYDEIKELHLRRYELKEIGVELFLNQGVTRFLIFNSKESRVEFVNTVLEKKNPHLSETSDPCVIMKRWQEGLITNFEYLMELNKLAGRSFNDLMQYPIYPFVLSDYKSEVLDLTDSKFFRNLRKPVSIQNPDKESKYQETYETIERECNQRKNDDVQFPGVDLGPYHYGSHYSNSDGNFDLPDRTFHSMADTWRLASEDSITDVKELLPDLFCLPDLFMNKEGLNFGVRQNGVVVNDVEVPLWSHKNPRMFIKIHRQALESNYVRENLCHWIDLVFGYKQSGQAAIDAINVFHPSTYYGFNVDSIQDSVQRSARIAMIQTYGQTPKQLFGLRWGKYIGSPDEKNPAIIWSSSIKKLAFTLVPISNNRIYGLPSNASLIFTKRCSNGDYGVIYWNNSNHRLYLQMKGLKKSTYFPEHVTSIGTCSKDMILKLYAQSSAITNLEICSEFGLVISASKDGVLIFWDIKKRSFIRSLTIKPQVTALCISSVSEGVSVNTIATGHASGLIRLWSSWDLSPMRDISTSQYYPILSLAFSLDNQHLYASTQNKEIIVFEKSESKGFSQPPKYLYCDDSGDSILCRLL